MLLAKDAPRDLCLTIGRKKEKKSIAVPNQTTSPLISFIVCISVAHWHVPQPKTHMSVLLSMQKKKKRKIRMLVLFMAHFSPLSTRKNWHISLCLKSWQHCRAHQSKVAVRDDETLPPSSPPPPLSPEALDRANSEHDPLANADALSATGSVESAPVATSSPAKVYGSVAEMKRSTKQVMTMRTAMEAGGGGYCQPPY